MAGIFSASSLSLKGAGSVIISDSNEENKENNLNENILEESQDDKIV